MVLQNHQQKFTSPSFIVQVTHVKITHAIHQLLDFDACGLVNPVAFVVTVWGRALHGQPLPIPHVHQLLLPWVRAVCSAKADLFAHVVYLDTCQGKTKAISDSYLAMNTTKFLHLSDQTMSCFVNFHSQQFATTQSLKVTMHQMFTVLVCN